MRLLMYPPDLEGAMKNNEEEENKHEILEEK